MPIISETPKDRYKQEGNKSTTFDLCKDICYAYNYDTFIVVRRCIIIGFRVQDFRFLYFEVSVRVI